MDDPKIVNCQNLLNQFQKIYIEHQKNLKRYHDDLKVWHNQIEEDLQHENREEICTVESASTHAPLRIEEPIMPVLFLPTITCNSCKTEFDALTTEFSYSNISKVNDCIRQLKSKIENIQENIPSLPPSSPLPPSPSPLEDASLKEINVTKSVDVPIKKEDVSLKSVEELTLKDVKGLSSKSVEEFSLLNNSNRLAGSPSIIAAVKRDIKEQKKTSNMWIILVGIAMLLFSVYLVYCIFKNVPYDIVCGKVALMNQSNAYLDAQKSHHRDEDDHHDDHDSIENELHHN
jgi:hypothetical protein